MEGWVLQTFPYSAEENYVPFSPRLKSNYESRDKSIELHDFIRPILLADQKSTVTFPEHRWMSISYSA